jgi:GT2 family glycosyltransferase
MRIGIGIPTYGRASILKETLADLGRQTRRPDRVVVCTARDEDVPASALESGAVELVVSEVGLPRQRNRIVDHLHDCDIVLFLDDDFLMQPDYLAVIERVFEERRNAVVVTGTVLADGATTSGISFAEARAVLAADAGCADRMRTVPTANGYGCNMAISLATLRRTGLRFDERLPLYAWQEDVDLSCRLAEHGEILRIEGARGVHLGVKSGRSDGRALGYSQVINPLYIARRVPAYTMRRAIAQMGRNIVANLMYSLRPEPWVDRRGRLRGNLLGLLDALRGRLFPEQVLGFLPTAKRRAATALPAPERAPASLRGNAAASFVSTYRPGSSAGESAQVQYRRITPP